MPLRAAQSNFSAGSDEIFHSCNRRAAYPLVPGQASTDRWIDALNEDKQPYGALIKDLRGSPSTDESESAGMLVGSASLNTVWWGKGAFATDHASATQFRIPGARRMGFYCAFVNSNASYTLEVTLPNQWGVEVIETWISPAAPNATRTHQLQTGFTTWTDAYTNNRSVVPVNAAFFNPNAAPLRWDDLGWTPDLFGATGTSKTIVNSDASTNRIELNNTTDLAAGNWVFITGWNGTPSTVNGQQRISAVLASPPRIELYANPVAQTGTLDITIAGNAGSVQEYTPPANENEQPALWGRMPIGQGFLLRNPGVGLRSIKLIARANNDAKDLIVPHWKTLDFGLRTLVEGASDIIDGSVIAYPSLRVGHQISQPNHPSTGGNLNHYIGPKKPESAVFSTTPPMIQLENGVRLRYVSVDTLYNVVSFAAVTGADAGDGANPHVYGKQLGDLETIDNRGEMPLGIGDPWMLRLRAKPKRVYVWGL